MPLSQYFFRATFSREIHIPATGTKIAPGQTPVKLYCSRKEWHFVLIGKRQVRVTVLLLDLQKAERLITWLQISSLLCSSSLTFPLPLSPYPLVERQLKEPDSRANGYTTDPCQICLQTNTFVDLVKDLDSSFFASPRLWSPGFV